MIYNNKREQRCIELFSRLKAHFYRIHNYDDAMKGYSSNESSKDFNRRLSEQEASLFLSLLIRFTAFTGIDGFNDYWFFLSDYIYQDEDEAAKENIEEKLKNEHHCSESDER